MLQPNLVQSPVWQQASDKEDDHILESSEGPCHRYLLTASGRWNNSSSGLHAMEHILIVDITTILQQLLFTIIGFD